MERLFLLIAVVSLLGCDDTEAATQQIVTGQACTAVCRIGARPEWPNEANWTDECPGPAFCAHSPAGTPECTPMRYTVGTIFKGTCDFY